MENKLKNAIREKITCMNKMKTILIKNIIKNKKLKNTQK